MKEIMNNVEVVDDNEVVENEIVPVNEVFDDEISEPDLSKRDMIIGGAVLGLAVAGAVALGRGLFKGGKAIVKKIKDKAAKKSVETPITAPIDEKPVEVDIPEEDDVEVVETE